MPHSKFKKAKSLVIEAMSGFRPASSRGSLVSGEEDQDDDEVINDAEEGVIEMTVAELKTYIKRLIQK